MMARRTFIVLSSNTSYPSVLNWDLNAYSIVSPLWMSGQSASFSCLKVSGSNPNSGNFQKSSWSHTKTLIPHALAVRYILVVFLYPLWHRPEASQWYIPTKVQLHRWMIQVLLGTFSQWHCDCGKTTTTANSMVALVTGACKIDKFPYWVPPL